MYDYCTVQKIYNRYNMVIDFKKGPTLFKGSRDMPLIFYPHEGELESSNIDQKLEVLLEAAERYKAVVLDAKNADALDPSKRTTPKMVSYAYNWDDIAKLLREIRELPESSPSSKVSKADKLTKLAAIYEVLRGAKMAKLEAVRLALINEASHLGTGTSQVA